MVQRYNLLMEPCRPGCLKHYEPLKGSSATLLVKGVEEAVNEYSEEF